jgi:glutathione S-transferase
MKLYFSPGACSLAVHIALREAGQTPDLVKVDLASHRTAVGADFFAINPRGYVPVLELEDGSRHTEVAALLQHVTGATTLEVAKWTAFIATELHKVFSPWLWHKETDDATRKACRDKLAQRFAELDAYAFTIVSWAPMLGIPLTPYPQLAAYLGRIAQRPAVHAALLAEGLVKA